MKEKKKKMKQKQSKKDQGFPGFSVVKNSLASVGDMSLIPGPWRSHTPRGN